MVSKICLGLGTEVQKRTGGLPKEANAPSMDLELTCNGKYCCFSQNEFERGIKVLNQISEIPNDSIEVTSNK